MQSRGDENLRADSIGPMLLGHPHGKSEKICPTSIVTLSVWAGPLPLSTLTVAAIVAGAPASPKLSYASERTTVVNLTPPESSGGGRGTTRRRDPGGPPPGACWSMKTAYAPEPMTISRL